MRELSAASPQMCLISDAKFFMRPGEITSLRRALSALSVVFLAP